MQMVFHLGVHCTDGDRLLRTLSNNRDWLTRHGTEIVQPTRHRGIFEEALLALNGGPATPEMVGIMLDAILDGDSPRRIVMSTPGFLGAPGRVSGREGLYFQIGRRAAALANLFPEARAEFFLAIRNPATLLSDILPIFSGGGYETLMQGRAPLELRWHEAIDRLVRAVPGRRIVIWCHEDAPLVWPEVVRTAGGIPPDVPLAGGLTYMHEILGDAGFPHLRATLKKAAPQTVAARRAIYAESMRDHAQPGILDQIVDLPGWTQDLVDQVTAAYRRDVAEIAQRPEVEFILP
jgi:hypothetical protein